MLVDVVTDAEHLFGKSTNETQQMKRFCSTNETPSTNETSLKLLGAVSFVEYVSFIEFYKWGFAR